MGLDSPNPVMMSKIYQSFDANPKLDYGFSDRVIDATKHQTEKEVWNTKVLKL